MKSQGVAATALLMLVFTLQGAARAGDADKDGGLEAGEPEGFAEEIALADNMMSSVRRGAKPARPAETTSE